MHCFSIIRKDLELHIGCQDYEQYQLWRYGLEYLCDKTNHYVRMKTRRAILSGDLVLSSKNELIQSPSKQKSNHHHHHNNRNNREESTSRSSSFWSSLFG